MRFYKFQYEHVSNASIIAIEDVLSARPDPEEISIKYADNSFMVVKAKGDAPIPKPMSMSKRKKGFKHKGRPKVDDSIQHAAACIVRDEIWTRNSGMYCEFLEVSEDDVIDYL